MICLFRSHAGPLAAAGGPRTDTGRERMAVARASRRTFLRGLTVSAAGLAVSPRLLAAQPRAIKVGVVSPVTGPMAEVGQDCRLGAQMAAEAINAAGGIKSMGGARI